MNLVFAHDHIFYENNNLYYSNGGLSKEVLRRYTDVFTNVNIVSRQELLDKIDDNLTLATYKNINFIKVPDFKSIKMLRNLYKAENIIKKEVINADFLIARLPSMIGNIAIKYAKKYSKPYLVEVVGCSWDAHWNYNFKGKIIALSSYIKQKRSVKNSEYAIYVTKEFLQKRYPSKGVSVNCSNVLIDDWDDTNIRKRINTIKNMDITEKIAIGTTAAVDVRYKGQDSVIRALSKLKKNGLTNFEYHLVGGGNQSYLKAVAKEYDVVDQVVFKGSMPQRDVLNWLDTIDLYIQPSKTEGLPRALIEAMSRGLFALGADVGGIPELLEKEYIFSKSKNNEEEIYELLKNLNKEEMMIQAKHNFYISKEYDKNSIESRRKNFLQRFKNQN